MQTDVCDEAVPLVMNDGLVGGPGLQVIIADQRHVFGFGIAARAAL
jgi:hypothetical protein